MKNKNNRYRSDAFAAIHEAADALYCVEAIDKVTMREFDDACLETMKDIKPSEIRAIREREHVSQTVFARYLNVSQNLISDWERGKRKPGGPAVRLLDIIRKHGIQSIV